MRESWVQSLDWEDPLEKGMVTHSSILAWRIPWMEESGTLQSMGLQRVRHDWATNIHTYTHTPLYIPISNVRRIKEFKFTSGSLENWKKLINYDIYTLHGKLLQSCPTLCDAMDCHCQAPLSMGSPGKNSGVRCHALLQGDLSNPTIESASLMPTCIGWWVLYH